MKLVIEIPDHIYEHAKNISEDSYDEWDAMRAIAKGLPYDPRPRGEWKRITAYEGKCPFCNYLIDLAFQWGTLPNFCPNCGADMRKEGDAE